MGLGSNEGTVGLGSNEGTVDLGSNEGTVDLDNEGTANAGINGTVELQWALEGKHNARMMHTCGGKIIYIPVQR